MKEYFSRRDFGKLSAAAFGGLVAGAALQGCGKKEPAPTGDGGKNVTAKHACRGLNECKNQGASGENACAGQGTCANPGSNDCNGHGGCHMPMKSDLVDARQTARAAFEARMKEKGVTVGAAPPEK